MLFSILLPLLCIGVSDEPKCSRFEFEKHLLEMLVRLEFELSQTNQKLGLAEKTMKMEIEELKQSNQNMRSELEELKQNDQKMTSELAAAALTEETMKMEIEELKQQDRNRVTELANFKEHSTKISQNLNEKLAKDIEDSTQSMELKLTNLATSTSAPRIYFFGTNPEETQILGRPIFRTILHNEGDSYDASTGLFTCRVPGLYHFAFGFSSSTDVFVACSIRSNYLSEVHSSSKDKYNSGSVTAYLYLDVGNTIDLRCLNWPEIYHDSSMWFTGALIKS